MAMNRRQFVSLAAATGAISLSGFGGATLHAMGAPTNRRFVFIIQRGAADGLAIAEPRGDSALAGLRPGLMAADPLRLDGHFALHPALPQLHKMILSGEAEVHHAIGTAYRARSHFDAQNVLESGGSTPNQLRSGWMNRLIGMLPDGMNNALALAPMVPLALTGKNPVGSHALEVERRAASDDLLIQAGALYAADAQLAPLWKKAVETKALVGETGATAASDAEAGRVAASLLAPANGARLVMLETSGWDTHSAQTARLTRQLTRLDSTLAALKAGMGAEWRNTLVLVATEFGRTAAINGTKGTDHGTGSLAIWAGGGMDSKTPVVAQWPGLSSNALYQGRDLMPTRRFDAMAADKIAAHFGLSPVQTIATLFPS